MTQQKWRELRQEYATTGISYRKIADKYGVSFNTLKDRAKREGWTKDKKGFESATMQKTLQKASTVLANTCVDQLTSVAKSAEVATAMVAKMMEDAEQFRRHLVQTRQKDGDQEQWDVEERMFDKYDTKALKDFTTAMKDLLYIIRNCYGLPTVVEQGAYDLALQRLQLEREKADILDQDTAITVEFTDELKEIAE